MLVPGDSAPGFKLFDSEKKIKTLEQYRGSNVVLLFFPLAFTSVCTAELCDVRDNLKIFEALNAQPLGISVDSLYTLAKYRQENQLNFPLLSDFNKEVSLSYHCIYETFGFGMRGVSKRGAFIVDKQGVIQYAEVLENAGLQPDFEKIQVKLRELTGQFLQIISKIRQGLCTSNKSKYYCVTNVKNHYLKKFLLILSIILVTTIQSEAQTRDLPSGNGTTIVRFYPNPATTSISFEFQKSFDKGYSLQIYNFLGRKMREENNLAERTLINLSDFTRGVYVYQLRDRTGRIVESGKFQVSK